MIFSRKSNEIAAVSRTNSIMGELDIKNLRMSKVVKTQPSSGAIFYGIHISDVFLFIRTNNNSGFIISIGGGITSPYSHIKFFVCSRIKQRRPYLEVADETGDIDGSEEVQLLRSPLTMFRYSQIRAHIKLRK